jgi:hypothetical protein
MCRGLIVKKINLASHGDHSNPNRNAKKKNSY